MEAIVEAAARILEQRGHDGFSTNAVAALAGVSIGSLYQYFPQKDALIGALIIRESARLVEDAEAARSEPTGRAGLSALVRAAVIHQLRRPTLARLLDFEEARAPLDADEGLAGGRFVGIIVDLLSRPDLPAQPDGEVAARDVKAIIEGMVDAAGERGETDLTRLMARVERAAFGYLGAAAQ